jgi:hypothetical protein
MLGVFVVKVKRILWLSRHMPQDAQRKELKAAFGKVELVIRPYTVAGGRDVESLMRAHRCDEVVAVLPVHVLADVVAHGIEPLYAVINRRTGKHERFYRIRGLRLEMEAIASDGSAGDRNEYDPGREELYEVPARGKPICAS